MIQARAENRRLQEQKELAELEAHNAALRISLLSTSANAATTAPTRIQSSRDIRLDPSTELTFKKKSFIPEKMRTYKGVTKKEYIYWFRNIEIKFRLSPEYFMDDRVKIV